LRSHQAFALASLASMVAIASYSAFVTKPRRRRVLIPSRGALRIVKRSRSGPRFASMQLRVFPFWWARACASSVFTAIKPESAHHRTPLSGSLYFGIARYAQTSQIFTRRSSGHGLAGHHIGDRMGNCPCDNRRDFVLVGTTDRAGHWWIIASGGVDDRWRRCSSGVGRGYRPQCTARQKPFRSPARASLGPSSRAAGPGGLLDKVARLTGKCLLVRLRSHF
jgi:hypothetical protein